MDAQIIESDLMQNLEIKKYYEEELEKAEIESDSVEIRHLRWRLGILEEVINVLQNYLRNLKEK